MADKLGKPVFPTGKRITEDVPMGQPRATNGHSTGTNHAKSFEELERLSREDETPEFYEDTLEGDGVEDYAALRREQPKPAGRQNPFELDIGEIKTAKDRGQAIEKAVGQVLAGLVVLGTIKLFGVDNAMEKDEAESVGEPITRMASRRVGKHLKALIPIAKIKNAQDRADVEEIISALAVYLFRVIMGIWERVQYQQELKKFAKRDPERYARYMASAAAMRQSTASMRSAEQNVPPQTMHAQAFNRAMAERARPVSKEAANAAAIAAMQQAAAMESIGNMLNEDVGAPQQYRINDKVIVNIPAGLEEGLEPIDGLTALLG